MNLLGLKFPTHLSHSTRMSTFFQNLYKKVILSRSCSATRLLITQRKEHDFPPSEPLSLAPGISVSNIHSFDFLACVFSFPFLSTPYTLFTFLTLYLTVHKQHLPCLQLHHTHICTTTPPPPPSHASLSLSLRLSQWRRCLTVTAGKV